MDLKVEPKPRKPRRPPGEPSLVRFYARELLDEVRQFRQALTRDNVASFFKTVAWTIPLTVMIWIYAEQHEKVVLNDVLIPIEVKSTDPQKIATLNAEEKVIMCDLSGPQSNLDRFKQSLSSNTVVVINLDTRILNTNQENMIPTLQNISDNPIFRAAGIVVAGCKPPTLVVNIDSKISRIVPIQAPPDLPAEVLFKPNSVKVEGPSRIVTALTSVKADIPAQLPILSQPGAHTVTVQLIEDAADNLSYSRTEVQATLTARESDVSFTLKDVRVWPFVNPVVESKYEIAPTYATLPEVKVVGPQEQIDKLQHADVYARLDVLTMESALNPQPVALQFENLPDGVHLDGPNPQMSFTVTPR